MFSMDTSQPVKKEIIAVLQPAPQQTQELSGQADANIRAIMEVDLSSLEGRRQITSAIEAFGKDLMQQSQQTNTLLETRIKDLSATGGESGTVANAISQLDEQMRALDPGGLDLTKTGLFGSIAKPIKSYFKKYEKANTTITNTLKQLDKGQKILRNDNTTLECEQQRMREIAMELEKQISLATCMDKGIEKEIEKARSQSLDEERIRFAEEEVLFPLRQRLMDMQQMQAVNQQGYFAMEVVRKNNKELIRAVDRAKFVTMSALRTAVMLAAALAHEKIVIDAVNGLNATTNTLITSTAQMLKTQGTEIHRQATEASVDIEGLRQAYADTFEALEAIDAYKREALPNMSQAIEGFAQLAEEGKRRMARMETEYTT